MRDLEIEVNYSVFISVAFILAGFIILKRRRRDSEEAKAVPEDACGEASTAGGLVEPMTTPCFSTGSGGGFTESRFPPTRYTARITPPGILAFTPAATPLSGVRWITLAASRPDSDYEHVEIIELVKRNEERGSARVRTNVLAPPSLLFLPYFVPSFHKAKTGGDCEQQPKRVSLLRSGLESFGIALVHGWGDDGAEWILLSGDSLTTCPRSEMP
ncbi:hypothetical protein SUGI_1078180 [Cryptomeria japonica]|nr:hypothetical protein SUGI_1078180 [Cryptomeria japonica]